MNPDSLQDRALRANNKVQALLQQLIAHRGEPQAHNSLRAHANQTMTELFQLTIEAQKTGENLDLIEDAKTTLLRHFPELITHEKETWADH